MFKKMACVVAVAAVLGGCNDDTIHTDTAEVERLNAEVTKLKQDVMILETSLDKAEGHKEHLAVPEDSLGPVIPPEDGFHSAEIVDGSGVYWITEGAYQVMFVVYNAADENGGGVVVVDAPPTIGAKVLEAITRVTDKPITHVVYSHNHGDHIASANLYPEGATYIAHEETARRLTEASPETYGAFLGGAIPPLPTVTFSDSYTLTVGDQTLQLDYKGAAHIPGNIFISVPEHKVLMLIDVIFPGWTPFENMAEAENIPEFYKAHETVLSYDFDHLVSGHVGRLGTREDVLKQKEYIADIRTNAMTALQNPETYAKVTEGLDPENSWLIFEKYLSATYSECQALTEQKWDNSTPEVSLAAVDVFTYSHCDKVVESLRID